MIGKEMLMFLYLIWKLNVKLIILLLFVIKEDIMILFFVEKFIVFVNIVLMLNVVIFDIMIRDFIIFLNINLIMNNFFGDVWDMFYESFFK